MIDKLAQIKNRWLDVEQQLSDPGVVNDMKKFTALNKEYKDLKPLVDAHDEYTNIISNIENNKDIIKNDDDPEIKEMAKMELGELNEQKEKLEEEVNQMLIPKDKEDSKNAILEIRAGTGGDEAGIFAGDLFRMYTKFIEKRKWKMELISQSEGSSGGYKEIVVEVTGEDVYADLKYESGVHRVQRVPKTESQGRVHTSAASVAVLPEAEEVDVHINPADLRIDTYRSSGAGGQHVNKTESAIRITHIPSGIVAESQESRNQHRNREIAMTRLRTKIYEVDLQKAMAEISARRKTLVSTGDRSAKIRTYNYPQGRVTDHRIGLTLYNLDGIIGGEIQQIIDALKVAENAEKLKAGESIV